MTLQDAFTFLIVCVGVVLLTASALMGVAMTIARKEFKNVGK